jgi:hypothetical protein
VPRGDHRARARHPGGRRLRGRDAHAGEGDSVTVSCAEGDTGHVYEGKLDIEIIDVALDRMPPCPTKIMMNVGNPELAFSFQRLPNEGVGLARLEFIISKNVGVHPKALIEYASLPADLKAEIATRIDAYGDPVEYYVAKIAEGVATIAAAFWPKKVIVRLSDFKSNEYSNLVGGKRYEPHEENPMLGFRGASRYLSEAFYDCFALECRAMKRVRDDMGLTNVELMIPFVRTLDEAKDVIALLAKNGPEARRQRPSRDHDVRDPEQRDPRRPVPRAFRRLLDRQQRHDAAHARRRPRRRRRDRGDVRRARRRGQGDAGDGDRRLPAQEALCRHLRAGAVRLSRPGRVAGRPQHREHVAQPGHGRRDLAPAGQARGQARHQDRCPADVRRVGRSAEGARTTAWFDAGCAVSPRADSISPPRALRARSSSRRMRRRWRSSRRCRSRRP